MPWVRQFQPSQVLQNKWSTDRVWLIVSAKLLIWKVDSSRWAAQYNKFILSLVWSGVGSSNRGDGSSHGRGWSWTQHGNNPRQQRWQQQQHQKPHLLFLTFFVVVVARHRLLSFVVTSCSPLLLCARSCEIYPLRWLDVRGWMLWEHQSRQIFNTWNQFFASCSIIFTAVPPQRVIDADVRCGTSPPFSSLISLLIVRPNVNYSWKCLE